MKTKNKNLAEPSKKKKWKWTIVEKPRLIFLATIFIICILISLNEILDVPNLLRGERARPIDWLEFTAELSSILLVSLSSIFLQKKAELKRKQTEEVLRESEERFRQLAENIDQVFWLTDWENNKLLYVNPSYEKFFGRSCQSVYEDRLSWYEVIHPDDRASVREALVKNAKLGQNTEIEYRIVRDDGAIRWIFDRNYPIRDKHGKVYRIVSIAEDITERKQAEERLKRERDFSQSILETANSMIVCLDGYAKITVFNQECERVTGYRREEVLGKAWPELFLPPDHRHAELKSFAKWVRAHPSDQYEGPIVTKSGETRTILWSNTAILGSDEVEVVAIAIGYDITGRKRAEEEAIQYTKNMELLSKAAMGFMELSADMDIYRFIGEQLRELIGDAIYVLINSFDQKTSRIQARAFLADDQDMQVVSKTLGTDPMGMSFVVSDEAWNGLIGGKLVRVPGGIYELAFGKIPKTACDTLEKLAGTGDIFVMGFTKKGKLYGSATIIMREGCELRNTDVVETFIRQAGVALQRKQAEEALNLSEQRLKRAQTIARIGCWDWDIQGNVLSWSDELYQLFGVSRATFELSYESIESLIHPDDRDLNSQQVKMLLGRANSGEYSFRAVHPAGEIRHLNQIFEVVRDDTGTAVRAFGTIQDITERKRVEEALRESEEKYRALIEAAGRAGEGIIIIQDSEEGEAVFVFVNDSFCKMSGYSREELVGRSPWDLVPHEISVRLKDWYKRRHLGESLPSHYEAAGVRKDGTIVPLELSIVTMPWEGKIATVLYLRDITERKRAEEVLRESKERFSKAFHASPDPMTLSRLSDGLLLEVNDSWEQVLGYSRAESIGTSSVTLGLWCDPVVREKCLQQLRETGSLRDFETELRRKTGEIRQVILSSEPLEIGGEQCLLTLIRDITERKKAEEILKKERQRLFSVLDIMPTFVYLQAPDYSVRFTNRKFRELFGDPGDRPCYEAFYGRKEPCDPCITLRVLERRAPQTWEWTSNEGHLYMIYEDLFPSEDGTDLVLEIGVDITERKRAEEVIRESEEKYRGVVENIGIGVSLISPNMEIMTLNHQMKKWFPNIDISKKPTCYQAFNNPPKEKVCSYCPTYKTLQDGLVHESITETPSGNKIINYRIVSSPIKDKSGKIIAAIEMVEDITERKRAEEKLIQSEQLFSKAFRTSPNLVGITTLKEGRIIDVSEAYCRVTGYKRDEFVGHTITDFDIWAEPEQRNRMLQKLQDGGRVRDLEVELRTKSGDIRILLFSADTITLNDELCLINVAIDITERKRAEEALKESEEKYKFLYEESQAINIIIGMDGKILDLNESAIKLFGYDKKDLLGKDAIEFVVPEQRETIAEQLAQELKRERTPQVPVEVLGKEMIHTLLFAEGHGTIFEKGNPIGILMSAIDITEKKKMEAQLIQSERLAAVGTLAYGIAHEFNNILAGILGNAEFGLVTNDPKEVKECFQIIEENCERAKSITNHLLAFSRQREAKKQSADVTEAVESVLGLMERDLEKQNIKLVRIFNPIPEIVCDLGELSEVALNLITNARDAMQPKGGTLTIEIGKKKDNIEMVFTDTGGGIPDSIKGRIFEPFVTTKGALGQSETPGTGLGLFLSYGIIQRYQGKIDVKSEMGKGSQFNIKIPISKNQNVPISVDVEEDESPEVPQNLNILLVDDEKPILSFIKKFLEAKGHSVSTSASGKKGLQIFKNRAFDLVLSDITMPDMDGIKLISKLKRIDSNVKLIALTGHLAEEKLDSAKKAGADQVLTKPFKNEDLYRAIGRVLAR
jgi:PAS domain S-box-containing protein